MHAPTRIHAHAALGAPADSDHLIYRPRSFPLSKLILPDPALPAMFSLFLFLDPAAARITRATTINRKYVSRCCRFTKFQRLDRFFKTGIETEWKYLQKTGTMLYAKQERDRDRILFINKLQMMNEKSREWERHVYTLHFRLFLPFLVSTFSRRRLSPHTFDSGWGLCCRGRAENMLHAQTFIYIYIYIPATRVTRQAWGAHYDAPFDVATFSKAAMRSHLSESQYRFFLTEEKERKSSIYTNASFSTMDLHFYILILCSFHRSLVTKFNWKKHIDKYYPSLYVSNFLSNLLIMFYRTKRNEKTKNFEGTFNSYFCDIETIIFNSKIARLS